MFDEHGHTTVSAVVQLRILESWGISVGPGITFGEASLRHIEPSIHIETVYEWALGNIHLGPSFEVAVDPDATHLTLGLHIGVGF